MAAPRQALLLAVVVAAACLASLASASDWMVGDKDGWRAKFNTTGWADGKTFTVGDTLMFMYPQGKHTVVQLSNKDDFVACNLNANPIATWKSGNDVVTLDKPGKVWFFCSVPGHCDNGMKLVINVEDGAPIPAPPGPSSSAPVTGYTVGAAVAVAAGAVVASVLAF
ncbi:hypothetical protein SETIT_2G043900v2 [Setaria italica]|uniref:Phytocyanin domain-containing protein n=1 Tax=Setaria italica TaxID=4555 RepID=K3ZZ63_SETIT|nr:basic blue protein [Setaria italica]RCV09621.1 hypothetical protein SETIT_2G043900v2 [Setaria italica]